MKNIALMYGGESSEHTISVISKTYLETQIDKTKFNVREFSLDAHFNFIHENKSFTLGHGFLSSKDEKWDVDYIIPCIHGYPGETGDIQSLLDAYGIAFLGCKSEASKICFNKVLTKLLLEHFNIETTPFISLFREDDPLKAYDFFNHHKEVFIKASNQGSSVGCFHITNKEELEQSLKEAFKLSDYVIIEKFLKARELEVAAFEFRDELHISHPGEIVVQSNFYDYQEKYSKDSKAQIIPQADIANQTVQKMIEISKKVFKCLNLKDLSRIDFFLDHDKIYVNEINTFPGMTEISLFPKMVKESGVNFKDFITDRINKGT